MKRFNTMKTRIKPIVAACALALAAGQAGAVDYYLAAKAYTKTMPDGTTVPMWGYVLDPDTGADLDGDGRAEGDCYETPVWADRIACVSALPDPVIPGPQLAMAPGEDILRIFLTNSLPVPTSIIIPGREMPHSNNTSNGPTWDDGSVGARTNLTQKVRSYGREAGATAGRRAYVWRASRDNPITDSGSFMYHSGTNPQLQVYMGLYGSVTKDAVAGEVYPGVPYTNDATLFYSEIDPAHNAAVAAGDTSYSPIDYHPSWFLINGEPYVAGTANIPVGIAGESTLLRFLSTASETHVPVLQGLHGMVHAEDGIQYGWTNTSDGTSGFVPREQYSIELPPLKTKDVIITPNAEGLYAVYDGNGYMTNPSNPDDFTQGDTVGGMLRFLEVSAVPNTAPVANADTAAVIELTSVLIDVLANDTDADGDALTITSVTNGTLGTVTTDGATVTYTSIGGVGADSFTYDISDGNGGTATGTVSVDVIAANVAPVATDDAYATDEDVALVVDAVNGVLANDTDADGDALTAVLVTGPANGTLTLNADGSFSYTPNADFNGADSFTYTANDATGVSNTATVAITVNAVNDAPVIVSTPVTAADEGVAYSYDVDATDVDGDALTYALALAPVGMTIDPVSGLISWTPDDTQVGDQNVTVSVSDGNGGVTTQSFIITVSAVVLESPPTAVEDAYSVNEDAILDEAAPGVLGNDIATDGDAMTAVLVSGPSCAWTDGPSGAGAFVLNADGSFHYEPIPNWNSSLIADNPFCPGFSGADQFSYMATDKDGNSNVVTVDITVNEMNDAPIAAADVLTMTAMGSINFPAPSVLANDNDVDLIPFDPAQVFAVRETEPNRGSIPDWPLNGDETTAGADGNFTYEFANLRVGVIATFNYHATDTLADSNTATVTIRRELSVGGIELEIDTENNVGKWNIQGRISNAVPNGSIIEATLNSSDPAVDGTVIGTHTETGGQAWGIVNENGPIPADGDTIDVRVITNLTEPEAASAYILGYPVP